VGVALLDVNVLLALAWPLHVHHGPARRWFSLQRPQGWATCSLTQAAFVRLSSQAGPVRQPVLVSEAIRVLEAAVSAPEHVFWPLERGIADVLPEIRQRLIGHQQVADALLLDLAVRQRGKFATFDRRVLTLLAPESQHQACLELIPVE
jgi:hypothetical protein